MSYNLDFGTEHEKIFFLFSLKNSKYLTKFYEGFFKSEEIDILANIARKFVEKFKEAPSKEQLKLLLSKTKYSEKLSNELVDLIFDIDLEEYDDEWLKHITESWIKWRNFDKQLKLATEFVKTSNPTPEGVDKIINDASAFISNGGNISFDKNYGSNFFNEESHVQSRDLKVESGRQFIDSITNGGYDIKSLVIYCAEPNKGKSIFLANDAANFIRMRKNVVFVTCEMSEKKVTKRIGANLLGVPMDKYDEMSRDKAAMKRRIDKLSVGVMPMGNLNIKEYPTSQATVKDIEIYLRELDALNGYKTDVLIVDYINIMSNSRLAASENTYMKIKMLAEDLRGLAVKLGILVITCTQLSKGGWDATDITMANIAESAGIAHTADMIYAIIQDTTMYVNNEYWLKVLKIRDGEGKGTKCRYTIDYNYMRLTETGEILQAAE